MRVFSNIDYARAYLASVVYGGKKSIADWVEIGKTIDVKKVNIDSNEVAKAITLVQDTEIGIAKIPAPLDTHVSFLLLQSVTCRDIIALFNMGAINPELVDTHEALQSEFLEKHPEYSRWERKEFKRVPMQWGYNGEKLCYDRYGVAGRNDFAAIYEKRFPLVEKLREAMKDGWDDQCGGYNWYLPDGFQAKIINEVGYITTHFGINNIDFTVYIKQRGKIGKNRKGSLCMCADATHSMDGYIQREVPRRAALTYNEAMYILNQCWEGKSHTGLEDISEQTRIYSAEWFYILRDEPQGISAKTRKELGKIALTLGNNPFELIMVHDEFQATVNHLNRLRILFNYIVAEIYASNWGEYIQKELDIKFPVAPFDKEVYLKLIKAEHMLRF